MIIYWTIFLFHANLGCALDKDVIQPDPVIVTQLGQSVSLTCFCRSNLMVRVSWFKQTVGQKPLLMESSYYPTKNSFYSKNFNKDFSETKRLSVKRGDGSSNLTISKTESGDSATYYCGAMEEGKLKFAEGTSLFVKGSESNSMSVLQQPVSESVQPGDSVTLNCTIHTETCAEHSVYWFRHGSGKFHPGIIYNNGDRRDQCENCPEAGSPTQSCVYNLPKRNLSLSDAGTYYCAVASCGEILFGKGTKLEMDYGCKKELLLVYCLGVALALCVIIIIVLGCVMYKMTKKTFLLCSGTHPQPSGLTVPSSHDQDQEDDDTLTSVHYAALNMIHKKPKTQRQRSAMERDTEYSGVRC
ncbi:uncharacterized protein LOC135510540 isoform X2 [Oncorhynchus masou masou]|uniref:uncharacterized protein LOC135510540 isoform X2 n=1 Tax=Oncorhynchus masou masou TaxID=90313 RepID=UPI003183D4D4